MPSPYFRLTPPHKLAYNFFSFQVPLRLEFDFDRDISALDVPLSFPLLVVEFFPALLCFSMS